MPSRCVVPANDKLHNTALLVIQIKRLFPTGDPPNRIRRSVNHNDKR
jgi:hypothetical protein